MSTIVTRIGKDALAGWLVGSVQLIHGNKELELLASCKTKGDIFETSPAHTPEW
jgi:hypothetical protein